MVGQGCWSSRGIIHWREFFIVIFATCSYHHPLYSLLKPMLIHMAVEQNGRVLIIFFHHVLDRCIDTLFCRIHRNREQRTKLKIRGSSR